MSTGFVPALAARHAADPSPLVLPSPTPPPPKPTIPWLASAVPIVGALGFWAFTGSVFALWFALLGPVIAVAGVVDGTRTARRARRAAEEDAAVARARVGVQVEERHAAERSALRARHPDVAGFLAHPDQIWRPVPDRASAIVVGVGAVASGVRLSGGAGDSADGDAALNRRARTVENAPVVVPLGSGIAVVGPRLVADAVVRALVLQLAFSRPPGEVALVGSDAAWARALPHATVPAPVTVKMGRAEGSSAESDVVLVVAAPGEALPPRCDTVLFLVSAAEARVESGGEVRRVTVEAVSAAQAEVIAAELATRASSLEAAVPEAQTVALSALGLVRRPAQARPGQPAPGSAAPGSSARGSAAPGLAVPIGLAGAQVAELDIVADGPHAVVTGMTGAGKSELLVTWVVALATAYSPAEVSFLLADFKGGTAFDALAELPHVTGVITDLDTVVARRAIESLRAELRHREAELARSAARDIAEMDLPRLVIVIDEFAALSRTHPELEALFTDIAARGRALGMHLVIGTQRAAGVLRDGLLANCPLRLSLRVADPHDSRAVVGTDEAASLPGGARGRGLAVVRRGGDSRTSRVRIALAEPSDIAAVVESGGDPARRPWLPALPAALSLSDLGPAEPGELVLGLLDEPDRQHQGPYRVVDRGLLVVGGAGAGKSTALRTLAAQLPPAARLWIGPDPEGAWDALATGAPPQPGTAVIVDDLDALAGRLPGEYGRIATEELERWIRGAGDLGLRILASAQRLSGPASRLADLFPRRLVLGTASRADHIALGGDGSDFVADLPKGRGTIDRRAVQVAMTADAADAAPRAASAPPWEPPAGVHGYVVRHAPAGVVERWEKTGVRIREVDGAGDVAEPEPDGRVMIMGDPEQWLGHPRLLARVRNLHTLVVDASCAADYRLLTGDRELPPFVGHGRGRAWECRSGRPARRVALAGVLAE